MFGLETAITNATVKVSGGAWGQRVRQRTLLSTDRSVSYGIGILPIGLMTFCLIFNPGLFQQGTINCSPFQYKDGSGDIKTSGNGNRFYMHKYCWEHTERVDLEEFYKNNSQVVPEYFNKENPTIADNSLLWHKNFPYLLLCLTAFASVPLILWTYVSGSEIKPEVELFGEFLEAVVKFVLKAVSKTKREEDVSHYFKRENEKITMQFSQMAKFMKHKSNSTKLIQGLFLYRLLNAVSLIGTAWIVYLIGVKNDQSTFTCHCKWFEGVGGIEPVLCSVQGVIVRVWISWLWIVGYGFLLVALVIGTVTDLMSMKNIYHSHNVLDLFKLIWTDEFLYSKVKTADDLKFIMLLASKNLNENKFIRLAFILLKRAKHATYLTGDDGAFTDYTNEWQKAQENINIRRRNQNLPDFAIQRNELKFRYNFMMMVREVWEDAQDGAMNSDIEKVMKSLE